MIVDFDKYKSVKDFRKNNLFYKREYLNSIYVAWEDDLVDEFFKELESLDYPLIHKKELIVDTFWFSNIVTLIDFLNPIQVSFVMAKNLYFYELLKYNIKFSDKENEKLFSNYKQVDPKSFDWEEAELNNYKFIISL